MCVYIYFCVTRQQILSLALSLTVSSFVLKKIFFQLSLFSSLFLNFIFLFLKCVILF